MKNRELEHAAFLVGQLARDYPNTARRISDILAKQPWPTDTLAGSTSGGDLSDPTGNTATQTWLEVLDEMDRCAHVIVACANRLDELVKRTPTLIDTGLETSRARCTGGQGMTGADHWGRPDCAELAVTRTGLCSACYQRQHHWTRNRQPA